MSLLNQVSWEDYLEKKKELSDVDGLARYMSSEMGMYTMIKMDNR